MWLELSQLGLRLCSRAVPTSPYADLYAALVCGVDAPPSHARALFVETGLIHVLVVSGAHLVFLERGLTWCPSPVRVFILGAYCWLTGFGAPVVRAFVRRLCTPALERRAWTRLQIEAAASLLVLLTYPPWLSSRSFLMSWLCALALVAPWPWRRPAALHTSLKCFVFLAPFCPNSLLSIGWNFALGPLIGDVLFPVSVLACLINWSAPFADLMWRAVLTLLELGPRAEPNFYFRPLAWIWWMPLLAHAALLWGEYRWRHTRAFS